MRRTIRIHSKEFPDLPSVSADINSPLFQLNCIGLACEAINRNKIKILMATIIENRVPEPMSRSVLVDNTDSGAGWAVAIIVLVAALFVGVFWYMRTHAPAVTPAPASTVQVNLPASTAPTAPAAQ